MTASHRWSWRPGRLDRRWITYALTVAVAAALSYFLSVAVGLNKAPYLASLGCVLFMQPFVYDSMVRAVGRMFGVLFGVALAVAVVVLIGPNGWSIGLLVLLGLVMAQVLRLGPGGALQVAISGVLVIGVIRDDPQYPALRIVETAVGVVVGLLVTTIFSRPAVEPATRSISGLIDEAGEILEELAGELRAGGSDDLTGLRQKGRDLGSMLDTANQRISAAHSSLRWNIKGRQASTKLARLEVIAGMMRPISSRVMTTIALMSEEQERPVMEHCADLMDGLAGLIHQVGVLGVSGIQPSDDLGSHPSPPARAVVDSVTEEGEPEDVADPRTLKRVTQELQQLRQRRTATWKMLQERWSAQPQRWLHFGLLLALADLIINEANQAVATIVATLN